MSQNTTTQALDECVKTLDTHPDFRIVRRYQKTTQYHDPADLGDGAEIKLGAIVDVETTGLDSDHDKIIEVAIVQFEFSADGRVFRIVDEFDQLEDPKQPLSPIVQQLTGLSDEELSGQAIDRDKCRAMIEPVAIVIAHNAEFDRQFLENFDPIFAEKAWGCSLSEIPWFDYGIESPKLEFLAYKFGFFYEQHRALSDCLATLHMLAQKIPGQDTVSLKQLLDHARQTSYRIWAISAPFEAKDKLKARGYRWSPGTDGRPKAWYIDTPEKDQEIEFLKQDIYQRDAAIKFDELNPFNRFSSRI